MESNNDSDDASGEGGDVNFADSPWDCDGCPPPFFELPPPPRPPFMGDGDFCESLAGNSKVGASSSSSSSSPYESCDNPLIIVDSGFRLENDLLNVLLVVICAVLLVAVALIAAVVIWRWDSWVLEVESFTMT